MKALLVGETQDGKLQNATYEALAFARTIGAETVHFMAGNAGTLPRVEGRLYLADSAQYGEYNPSVHKEMLLAVIRDESPDLVIFSHSSYGWDLAPRLCAALKAPQISEVVGYENGEFLVPVCNSKLRRYVKANAPLTVVTLQAGAFSLSEDPSGSPEVLPATSTAAAALEFLGYEAADKGGVDLSKAEVIVSAGRGVGKPENLPMVASLAKALGGEMGASRPIVDAGWAEHNRQVGSTGQSVAPKLYVACGISGAIQHIAGMKKSEFVVAVNTDKDAPIGEIADVLVVADCKTFIPALLAKIEGR